MSDLVIKTNLRSLPRTKHDLPLPRFDPCPVIETINDMNFLTVCCSKCGEDHEKELTETEAADVIAMYENNGVSPKGLSQDVFPGWTNAERELFLLSHLCGSCWDELMSPPEEEDGE